MMEIFDYISTWSVLKWVILVLIAGFIGQFGRIMAEGIITRIRLKRVKKQTLADSIAPQANAKPVLLSDFPEKSMPPQSPDAREYLNKKILKIQAKARKNEAKKNK